MRDSKNSILLTATILFLAIGPSLPSTAQGTQNSGTRHHIGRVSLHPKVEYPSPVSGVVTKAPKPHNLMDEFYSSQGVLIKAPVPAKMKDRTCLASQLTGTPYEWPDADAATPACTYFEAGEPVTLVSTYMGLALVSSQRRAQDGIVPLSSVQAPSEPKIYGLNGGYFAALQDENLMSLALTTFLDPAAMEYKRTNFFRRFKRVLPASTAPGGATSLEFAKRLIKYASPAEDSAVSGFYYYPDVLDRMLFAWQDIVTNIETTFLHNTSAFLETRLTDLNNRLFLLKKKAAFLEPQCGDADIFTCSKRGLPDILEAEILDQRRQHAQSNSPAPGPDLRLLRLRAKLRVDEQKELNQQAISDVEQQLAATMSQTAQLSHQMQDGKISFDRPVVIEDVYVTKGQTVEAGQPLFSISKPDSLMLVWELDPTAQYAAHFAVGDTVSVFLQNAASLPGYDRLFRGRPPFYTGISPWASIGTQGFYGRIVNKTSEYRDNTEFYSVTIEISTPVTPQGWVIEVTEKSGPDGVTKPYITRPANRPARLVSAERVLNRGDRLEFSIFPGIWPNADLARQRYGDYYDAD